MTKPTTSVVNIRLDTGTIEAIRAVAEAEGRTWAGQVRYILAGWMRAQEGRPLPAVAPKVASDPVSPSGPC